MNRFSKAVFLIILPATLLSTFACSPQTDPNDTPDASKETVEKTVSDAAGFQPLRLTKVKDFDGLARQYPAFKSYLQEAKEDLSGPVEAFFGTVKYNKDRPEIAFLRMTGGGQCGTLGCTLLASMKHEGKDILVLNVAVHGDNFMLRTEGGTIKSYFCGSDGSREWELKTVLDPVTKVMKPEFMPSNNKLQPKSPACIRPAP